MSCSLTVDAVRNRTKTVTRRHVETWAFLQPGDRLTLVEKAMGLPKGAKQVVLADVEVISVGQETLRAVTADDVRREGLWDRAVVEGAAYADWFDEDFQPVAWFRAFWASTHLHGSLGDWLIGSRAGALSGVLCNRIEWRYLDGEPSTTHAEGPC